MVPSTNFVLCVVFVLQFFFWVRTAHIDVNSVYHIRIRDVIVSTFIPLGECGVVCNLFKGFARVGLVDSLPESGVDFILKNYLAKSEDIATPVLSTLPVPVALVDDNLETFSICASNRSLDCVEESQWEETTGRASCVDVPEVSSAAPDDPAQVILQSETFMGYLEDAPSVIVEEVGVER